MYAASSRRLAIRRFLAYSKKCTNTGLMPTQRPTRTLSAVRARMSTWKLLRQSLAQPQKLFKAYDDSTDKTWRQETRIKRLEPGCRGIDAD